MNKQMTNLSGKLETKRQTNENFRTEEYNILNEKFIEEA